MRSRREPAGVLDVNVRVEQTFYRTKVLTNRVVGTPDTVRLKAPARQVHNSVRNVAVDLGLLRLLILSTKTLDTVRAYARIDVSQLREVDMSVAGLFALVIVVAPLLLAWAIQHINIVKVF
jgi:hypothetical protein